MRDVLESTWQQLTSGGWRESFTADLVFDNERVVAGLQLAPGADLSWDGSAQIVGRGTLDIVRTDTHGQSLAPERVGDWLSPFGGELQVSCIVGTGRRQERVPVGRFVITKAPQAIQDVIEIAGRRRVVAERIRVQVLDPLVRQQRDKFPFPTSPSTGTVWDEIQQLSRMQVVRNLPDTPVPAGLAYEQNHLTSLVDLFAALDAWPYVRPDGVLTSRPKQPGAIVADINADLMVSDITSEMDPEGVYNQVAGEAKAADGSPLRAIAKITDGPLRTENKDGSQSPFGTATYKVTPDSITTQQQLDDYVLATLARVSRLQTRTVQVAMPGAWLLEVGDVVRVTSKKGTPLEDVFTGRVMKVSLDSLSLEVTDAA